MTTERGLDRLVNFSDAVVAIAITLLVLPLVDVATSAGHVPTRRLLTDHWAQLGVFSLSFVVIARLWRTHHRLFEGVGDYDQRIVTFTISWLLTVVFLPFPTQLLVAEPVNRLTCGLYIGTLLASSLCLGLTADRLRRRPDLRNETYAGTTQPVPWLLTALLAVALAVGVAFPAIGLWSLLVLFLTGPLQAFILRRRSGPPRREAGP